MATIKDTGITTPMLEKQLKVRDRTQEVIRRVSSHLFSYHSIDQIASFILVNLYVLKIFLAFSSGMRYLSLNSNELMLTEIFYL